MSIAAPITATGSIMILPGSFEARYQVIPQNKRMSVTLSLTESKKAPLMDEVPLALATAPSRASGNPVRIRKTNPRNKRPCPINIAPTEAITIPAAVRAFAVIPILLKATPTGSRTLSTPLRKLPSNTLTPSCYRPM